MSPSINNSTRVIYKTYFSKPAINKTEKKLSRNYARVNKEDSSWQKITKNQRKSVIVDFEHEFVY